MKSLSGHCVHLSKCDFFFSSFMINNQKKTFKKVKNSVVSGGPFNHKAV